MRSRERSFNSPASSSIGSADASGNGGNSKGSTVSAGGGNGTTPAGAGPGSSPEDAAGSGSGSGGGGGGGGGGADYTDPNLDVNGTTAQIEALMDQAKKKREQAGKDEKYAIALAAAGQGPQSVYHYEKARKEKSEAKDLENQANQLVGTMAVPAPSGGH